MRKQAANHGTAAATQTCPRCKGAGRLMLPARATAESAVYGCPACGFAFTATGSQYVDNLKEMKDFFRGATLGQKVVTEGLKDTELSPAAKALLTAQILEYGTTMWFDGLKQGLLLGALDQNYRSDTDGKVQPG